MRGRGPLRGLLGYREAGVAAAVVLLWIAFTAVNPAMASGEAAARVLNLAADRGVVAVGVALLMIGGEFDLSVGSVYGMSALVFVESVNSGAPPALAAAASLGLSALVGLANAALTIYGRIPSFIATLGTMWVIRAAIYVYTGGLSRYLEADPGLVGLLYAPLAGGVMTAALVFAAAAALFHLILTSTPYGNHLQAVGGSPGVARALGISVARVKTLAFIASSTLAGLGGLIYVARFDSVEAVTGNELPLEVIAASVIGGCSLQGGVGTIAGAALGALLISEINVGLVLAGVPGYWYIGFVGALLIVAGVLNERLGRRG